MVQSKAWNWSNVEQDKWVRPSEDSVYLAKKWQEEGVHSILDLGCGRGRHALYFTQKGFKVTAVDLSAEAIEYNKRMQKEQGVDYLCKRADMMKLPFANDAFDRVFSYHVSGYGGSAAGTSGNRPGIKARRQGIFNPLLQRTLCFFARRFPQIG